MPSMLEEISIFEDATNDRNPGVSGYAIHDNHSTVWPACMAHGKTEWPSAPRVTMNVRVLRPRHIIYSILEQDIQRGKRQALLSWHRARCWLMLSRQLRLSLAQERVCDCFSTVVLMG